MSQVIVTMRCVVIKVVVCEHCTVEEAKADPFKYSIDETDVDLVDWDVTSAQVEE